MSKPYTLKSPCAKCPFLRANVFLTHERAQSIQEECEEEANFYCHATVSYESEPEITSRSRICAGFLITMERSDNANQPTRIAERLGIYDRNALDMDAPTFDSMDEWVQAHDRDGE